MSCTTSVRLRFILVGSSAHFRLIAMTTRRTKARKKFLKQRLHASTIARMLAKPSKSLEKNKINLDWASACGFIALFNQDREQACVLQISSDEEAQNTNFDLLMLCCRDGRKKMSFRRSCGRSTAKRTCCIQMQRGAKTVHFMLALPVVALATALQSPGAADRRARH